MNSDQTTALKNAQSLPALLVRNAERFGDQSIALREKEFGIWQSVTWQQYLEHVRDFSLGLISLGLRPGETLGIIGDNRPEWVYAELAAQAAGVVPFGIFQDSILSEVAYIIEHSEAAMLVAEDQEQVDKILDLKEKLPRLKKIIYTDPKGLWDYEEDLLIEFTQIEQRGRELHRKEPDLFDKNVRAIKDSDLAIVCYTSGTTGNPKGTLLTHANILSMVAALNEADFKSPDDQFLSFIPLPWIVEQTMNRP
jgi:long-chain acyl-CoA synthetase